MQWSDDTTLPKRGLRLIIRPIGKSSKCFRVTQAFSRAVTHCPRVFWMRLPGLVARACFRWRLGKQTPRRTNLAGAPSRGLRHGHVGSDDGPYRGDCSEAVDMA